jgi:hypothetical protein
MNRYYDADVKIESYVSFREDLGTGIYIDCSFCSHGYNKC